MNLANKLPFISILVAVRDEEKHIEACLEKLARLNYPSDALEILIGDDQSEDNTVAIVESFIAQRSQFKLFFIRERMGKAQGKANVLAHLAKVARGTLLFMTDADIRVSSDWLNLRSHFETNTNLGILTACTLIQGRSFFARIQALDWTYGFALLKMSSDLSIPITAVGNNMVVRKEAYEAVGGYAQIPFSITEDFALYKAVIGQGYDFKQVIEKDTLAFSEPSPNLISLLQQRKRWLRGGLESATYVRLLVFSQTFIAPFLVILLIINPKLGLMVWAIKVISQWALIIPILRHLRQRHLLKYLVFFEFYSIFFMIVLIIFYLLPVKVVWKGRTYT